MTESEGHRILVALLQGHIADRFCMGQRDCVLIDSATDHELARPPLIDGYVPDAYVLLDEAGKVVIGEAKTTNDLVTPHSEAQVRAFLRRCGRAEGSTLILAVPWPVESFANTFLRDLRDREALYRINIDVISPANPHRKARSVGMSARCNS